MPASVRELPMCNMWSNAIECAVIFGETTCKAVKIWMLFARLLQGRRYRLITTHHVGHAERILPVQYI